MSASLKLLKKVRCRLLDKASGEPVPGIVTSLSVQVDDGAAPHIPVSTLRSDSTGYLSFDLQPLVELGLDTVASVYVSAPQAGLKERDLLKAITSSNGDGGGDGGNPGAMALSSTRTRVNGGRSLAIEFPIYLDKAKIEDTEVGSPCASPLPAIQAPDSFDYELSPYSLVTPAQPNVGSDCCERIAPSTLPVQEHGFYRVVVRRDLDDDGEAQAGPIAHAVAVDGELKAPKPIVKFAEVLEYRQRWYAIGHSLGDIKYSLPLAPGESTELAVIEWSREDTASRKDTVGETEFLQHELHRDRAIEDSVDAGLKESQGGWSWTGGLSSGMAYDAKAYGQYTGNWAAGGGTSNTWGERNVEADSQQDLHDTITQGTSFVRSLTSTVIVQATQAEHDAVQTRRVANHNHCHALTMQYYEVLRHFRLRTEFVRRRKAVLIPFHPFAFTTTLALRFRTQLEEALLDESLLPCFDALIRREIGSAAYEDEPEEPPPPPAPAPAAPSYFTGTKSNLSVDSAQQSTSTGLLIQKGSTVTVSATGEAKFGQAWIDPIGPQGMDQEAKLPYPGVGMHELALLAQVGGDLYEVGTGKTFTAKNDGTLKFFFNDYKFDDNKGTASVDFTVTKPAPDAPGPTDPTPQPQQDAEPGAVSERSDRICEQRLLAHLNGNRGYYDRAVWTLMDPSDRRLYLEATLGSDSDLLAAIDDKPIAISGNLVAFAFNGPIPDWNYQAEDDPDPLESIVTLPTRGLFGEAQLGNCNSCEKRDVTRMWDWTVMTAEEPPEITGISPGPRGTTPDLTPAQLPPSVIQITQPPAAPDPTGLAQAMEVLRTPNIFRDMSALDEASALLGKLADGTIKTLEGMTKAAGQAKEKVDTARKDNAGTSANGTSSNGKTAAPASNRAAASESDAGDQIDRLKAIEEAKQAKLINDEQANNAAVGLLGGEVIPALALDKNVSMPMGIDISHWNGNVDWERVAAAGNVYFAFIKASDGTSVDNKFQLNWRDARDAGLACGAYHFWLPQKSGKSQAQTLIRQLGFLQRGDLPPVLDVEDTAGHSDFSGKSPSDLEDNIQEFLDTVEAEFGVKPIIYTGPAFWKQANRMNKSEKFADYPLWISNWDPKNDPTLPGGWPTWDFWQFTEGGSIDGVHSPPTVDFSFYNGDLKSLWRMAGRNPSEITA